MLKKQLPPFAGYLVSFAVGSLLLFPLSYVWRMLHPKPVLVSTLPALAMAVDLHFPPQTALVAGGYVNQTSTFYPASWSYGVVTMPAKATAQFLKQATVVPKSQTEIEKIKSWMVDAPRRENFGAAIWNIADVKSYSAVYYAGAGGQIFVDRDNPAVSTVYVLFGG